MDLESNPLSKLAVEPNWVEIDPPTEDDDEYTLGYYDEYQIRVSQPIESIESMDEFQSGPYNITLISEDGNRMVFVEKTERTEEDGETPKTTLSMYNNKVSTRVPDSVAQDIGIEDGDRFNFTLDVEEKSIILNLRRGDGDIDATVVESFDQDSMTEELELHFSGVLGELIDLTNRTVVAEWKMSQGTVDIVISDCLPRATISSEKIKETDPVKMLFNIGEDIHQYELGIEASNPAADPFEDCNGFEFRLAEYNGTEIIYAKKVESPSEYSYARTVEKDDGDYKFGVPERIGDMLNLHTRSWVRLQWSGNRLYILPTNTYGAAPLLK